MANGQSGARMRRLKAFCTRLQQEDEAKRDTTEAARLWTALRRLVVALAGGGA